MPIQEAANKLNQNRQQHKAITQDAKICPIRDIMDHLGDKWSIILLVTLSAQSYRFAELQRETGEISQRVLAQTLRDLERDGLVNRTVYPTNPPRVEYSLTFLGRSLLVPIWKLSEWVDENHHYIIKARKRFERLKK